MDVITTHLHADFDGLAAMVAARKLYPGAVLVLSGGAQETVRRFLAVHDLGLTRLKDLEMQQVTRLILVDTQEPERLGPLQPLCRNPAVAIHIFDHHPETAAESGQGICQAECKVVEPVGATTTVLIERMLQQGRALSPLEATVLALGLYDETGFFAYVSTTPRDLEAAAAVRRAGADLTVVADTLRQPLDPDAIALLHDLLQRGETYYLEGCKVLLTTSQDERFRGDLAEVVHRLTELKGLDAVVAAIALEDKIEIIGRSRRSCLDVAQIVAEFGGGGHPGAAAAIVKDRTMVEVCAQLRHLLTTRYRPTCLARDMMTSPVTTIPEEATLTEAAQCMTMSRVTVVPVVDQHEHYRGVVTQARVQKALVHGMGDAPVQTCLQTALYTATPETPWRDMERQMLARKQHWVPILSGTPAAPRVVGIITRADLLRTLHEHVLATAGVRVQGPPVPGALPVARRNLRGMLRAHVPRSLYRLLERLGRCADTHRVSAYIVGSWVRDLLLGRRNPDLDIVVAGDGLALAQALAQQEGVRLTTQARSGTAVVLGPEGFTLRVATTRVASNACPIPLPPVGQGSLQHDLTRRDFTINTLAIWLNTQHFGELLDVYGGQRDLKDKTLRVVHSHSFVDEPTRVFRAIRFEVSFGLHLGKETLRLMQGAATMGLLHQLSSVRLGEEIRLLLSERDAHKAVARLAALNLLRFIHAEVTWSPKLDHLLQNVDDILAWYQIASLHWPPCPMRADGTVERPGDEIEPWLVRLIALLEALSDLAVPEAFQRLNLLRRHADTVHAARAARHTIPRLATRPPLLPAETYRILTGQRVEVLLFLLAKTTTTAAKQQIVAYLETYRYVKPQLSGHDLRAMGLTPGPLFRKLLDRLLEARLNGEVMNATEERAFVQRLTCSPRLA
jgi:tRNA nucleotidyltransferase (CCA-adding enzyme)